MPEWLKSTGFFILIMITWDIIRLFLQAYVTKKMIKSDLEEVVDDVEEIIEENEEEEKSGEK